MQNGNLCYKFNSSSTSSRGGGASKANVSIIIINTWGLGSWKYISTSICVIDIVPGIMQFVKDGCFTLLLYNYYVITKKFV